MTDEYNDIQSRLLTTLQAKLEAAGQNLSKLEHRDKPGRRKKLKLAFVKETLDNSIAELESWQKICEPSWFCWIKLALASPTVNTALSGLSTTDSSSGSGLKTLIAAARDFRRAFEEPTETPQSVFIGERYLDGYTTVDVPSHSTKVVTLAGRPQRLIMDVIDVVPNTSDQMKNVREFARRLRQSEHSIMGLLSCKGVVRHADNTRISYLFRVPDCYHDILGLRELLLSGRSHDSLSDRLEMAKQLAKAVYYVHLYDVVHKNIRPETILSLGKAGEGRVPSSVCLVGFQVIRMADGRTYPSSDLRWEKNLYRHPQRQGNNIEYFVMQHDIYSLGVCLLEIGLWESFVVYDGAEGAARPSPALGLAEDLAELKDPIMLKDHLVELSQSTRVRAKMGTKYSEVVETCLTCLDPDNDNFGDEKAFRDEDGIEVGARYIDKVLGVLNGISV